MSARRQEGAAQRRLLAAIIGLTLAGWGHPAAAYTATASAAVDAAVDANFDRSMLSGAGQNTTDLSRRVAK